MRFFLIRHAECQQNVGQATNEDAENSSLTETGKLQVNRLALYFRDHLIQFTRVFSSDLDRATDTANAICDYQLGATAAQMRPVQTPLLREQQFGSSLEEMRDRSGYAESGIGLKGRGGNPFHTEEETVDEMRERASSFLKKYILPLLLDRYYPVGEGGSNSNTSKKRGDENEEDAVAIVAHSVMLQIFWVCLTDLFNPEDIHFGSSLDQTDFKDKAAPIWSNTGVMELDIEPSSSTSPSSRRTVGPTPDSTGAGVSPTTSMKSVPSARPNQRGLTPFKSTSPLEGWSMTVLAIDSTVHLANSTTKTGRREDTVHDTRQKPMDEFYRITGAA